MSKVLSPDLETIAWPDFVKFVCLPSHHLRNQVKAAELLGIWRPTRYNKLKRDAIEL